ncbi:MAG: hypothetical protein ACLFRI_03505 [Candidatus Izemoplasmataceae bacterium]
MNDDPILIFSLLGAFVAIPLISLALSKIHNIFLFITPIFLMGISLVLFLFVVIVPTLPISRIFFYFSMSVWTASSFSLFINLFIYGIKKVNQK